MEGNTSEILLPLLTGVCCIGMAVLALVGVIVLFYVNGKRSPKKVTVDPTWPTVPGRVTAARVEETARTRVDEDTFYFPLIEFEYTLAGQVRTGRQAVGKPFNLESKAKRRLEQYPLGTQVLVVYDPQDPDKARVVVN
jgi:hypothetical protein